MSKAISKKYHNYTYHVVRTQGTWGFWLFTPQGNHHSSGYGHTSADDAEQSVRSWIDTIINPGPYPA